MPLNKVFVYGTLRPGTGKTVEIPGFMYDLGWYPGVTVGDAGCNSWFIAEELYVDDERLRRFDRYESYYEDDHETSLYLRVPYLDGWIYVFNQDLEGYPVVEGGDWLKYTKASRGSSAAMAEAVA